MSTIRVFIPLVRRILSEQLAKEWHPTPRLSLSTSSQSNAETFRKVQEYEDGDTLVVEGVQKEIAGSSELKESHSACPICSRNIQLKYTDVLILDQFVSKKGKILPMKVTGVCGKQHEILKACIEMAQKAGLLHAPDLGDSGPPPEKLRIPRGNFNIFYNKTRKNYKIGNIK